MLSENINNIRQRLFSFRCSLITLAVLELGVRLIALYKRIKDTWYSIVVDECRAGDLREDTYNFIHGYPTSACGSSLLEQASSCDCQVVIDAGLDGLRHAWVQERKQNVPASTMHDSHTIGSVPVCRVNASTMQETHTKG